MMSVKLFFYFCVYLVLVSCIQEPVYVYSIDVRIVDDFENAPSNSSVERIKKRVGFIGSEVQVLQKNEKELAITFKSDVPETEVRRILTTSGNLAFYKTKNAEKMTGLIEALMAQESFPELGSVFNMAPHSSASMLGFSKAKDTASINKRLQDPQINLFLEKEYTHIKFAWGIPDDSSGLLPLFTLCLDENRKPFMYGDIVEAASASTNVIGEPNISLLMKTGELSRKWEELTGLAAKERFAIAVVLDDIVYKAPMASMAIKGGRSELSGNFTKEQTKSLAVILGVGSIPKLNIVQLNQQSNK